MSFRYKGGVISATAPTTSTSSATGIWTTTQQMQAVAAGNWPPSGYQISRSLRFNPSDSPSLARTPGTTGNRRTWTYSVWVKLSSLSATCYLFGSTGGPTSSYTDFYIYGGQLYSDCGPDASRVQAYSNAYLRDPSAWYHIVIAFDTTQATSSNRIKFYINNVQLTLSGAFPAQNFQGNVNYATLVQTIGTRGADYYFGGYMTEAYLVDGQALTPSSFGAYDANGVWSPTTYGGTYGTNGFYINFSDNSNNTAATLGKDYSGNGNNYTPTNFSVTAGSGNDSLVDTPTNYGTDTGVGGEVRGNYATWNPIDISASGITLADGNLVANNSTFNQGVRATFAMSSGKWYWEVTVTAVGSGNDLIGIANAAWDKTYVGNSTGSYGYYAAGSKYNNGTGVAYGASYTTGDVIGVAFDADAGTLIFYKNGTSQGTAYSGISGQFFPAISGYTSSSLTANFGQRAFASTAPSGYKALCSTNLASATITNGAQYMAATLYTGTGAVASISNTVNSVSFQPDFVWLKSRSAAYGHALFDSTRGVGNGLQTNNTNTQAAWGTSTLSSFSASGFGVGADTTYLIANNSGTTYVGWQWKANGGTTVSNTSGSITSTVQANTTAGFSIVSYTGTGANATVGHGLTVAPSFIIVKCLNQASRYWAIYNSASGATNLLYLNATDAVTATALAWNNTAPTTSVFSVGTGSDTNSNTYNFIAYCFAQVAGFSSSGSYTGNGSADGPFVYCGFRPRFVLLKRTDAIASWAIMDTSRDTVNVAGNDLYPNLSNAETDDRPMLDILSNGFKLRSTYTSTNTSGGTYIYLAFAENPFNYSRAR